MKSSICSGVTDAVVSAKGAYGRYIKLTLNERQEVLEGVKKAFRPFANELATMTVTKTGMGIAQDKAQKIKLAIEKTPGVEDLITEVNTGDHGITLYELSSFGIVRAVQPCTNPCATLASNTIGILATGNAVTHCPHPRVVEVSQFLTTTISGTIHSISGIDNLVVTLHESPMRFTTEVVSHPDVDLVVCAGGNGPLHQAMTSGKKVIGAGPANPVTIVDATANLGKTARDIVRGTSFDSNLMCTSEKCMVVEESISDHFIYELLKNGVYYIQNEAEIQKLLNAAVTEDFVVNKKLESRSARKILEYTGTPASRTIKLIMAETGRMHLFVITELMMPLVPSVKAADFDEALEIALEVKQGYKHTATIRSESIEHLNRAVRELQTSMLVKNGPSLMGIGFDKEGHTSLTIATITGEGTTTARHSAHKRKYTLTSGFSIR